MNAGVPLWDPHADVPSCLWKLGYDVGAGPVPMPRPHAWCPGHGLITVAQPVSIPDSLLWPHGCPVPMP